jgi:hypothetical protein
MTDHNHIDTPPSSDSISIHVCLFQKLLETFRQLDKLPSLKSPHKVWDISPDGYSHRGVFYLGYLPSSSSAIQPTLSAAIASETASVYGL